MQQKALTSPQYNNHLHRENQDLRGKLEFYKGMEACFSNYVFTGQKVGTDSAESETGQKVETESDKTETESSADNQTESQQSP